MPIRAILENDYPSAFGPEDIANLTAAFEAALSKLELVDRKDPMTMTVAIGSPLGEPSVEIKTQQERITRGPAAQVLRCTAY